MDDGRNIKITIYNDSLARNTNERQKNEKKQLQDNALKNTQEKLCQNTQMWDI